MSENSNDFKKVEQVNNLLDIWSEKNQPGKKNCFDSLVTPEEITDQVGKYLNEVVSVDDVRTYLTEKGYVVGWDDGKFGFLILN